MRIRPNIHNAYQSLCTLCTQKEKFVSQNIHNDCSFIILFLCSSVTLSSFQATCFFVLLLLCLFYKQLVLSSFCYSVFFTSNLFLCPPVILSSLQTTCQLVHLSTRQLITQLLKILNIVFTTMNIRKNMFIFAADFMK